MNNWEVCKLCVMDESDTDLVLNEEGICNYCIDYDKVKDNYSFTPEEEEQNLLKIKDELERNQGNNQYNCIIGMSGGVDSSYVCYLAKKLELKPLCVHFDNGWNSETAVRNIHKIVNNCGFDLETYVIDWPEFKDLQRSFFKASVLDIEMLTDHAIMATMHKIRKQYKIGATIIGTNVTTEFGMPNSWLWYKQDLKNIKSIQKKFGTKKIKNFPTMGMFHYMLSNKLNSSHNFVEILNKITYSKDMAMQKLNEEFDWEYYGGKHYESVFTKFYQAYYLPEKFGIDKRKSHFSCLIRNGELSREHAMQELKEPAYNPAELKNDLNYILKKLSFSEEEFEGIMKMDPVSHSQYPNDRKTYEKILKLWFKIKPLVRKN